MTHPIRYYINLIEASARKGLGDDPEPWESWQQHPKLEYHATGGILWIDMFEIPRKYRKTGAGAKLWKYFEESIPPEKYPLIKLMAADTGDGDGSSEGFWRKMGFEVESRGEKNGIIMRKRNPNPPTET